MQPVSTLGRINPVINNKRIDAIDILRGIIMVVMALDHVRDFFSTATFAPEDVSQTTPAWFFTRWITHYCAPIFVLLAGMSAAIYGKRVSRSQLSKFLWSRGIWLIIMEFTVVHWGWTLSLGSVYWVQVIWVIGLAMIILSGLIYLPRWFMVAFTIVLIGGHNLLDPIQIESYWWYFLHVQYWGEPLVVGYPIIPWAAVMTLGFLLGDLYILDETRRKRQLVMLGIGFTALFVLLRLTNVYGDMHPWEVQPRGLVYTFLSFLNTTKYPPSLLYICMTIGPACLALAGMEHWKGRIANFFLTFGRVPFFYYIMHLFLAQAMVIIYHGIVYHDWRNWMFDDASTWPANYHATLLPTYIAWITLIALLYPLSRWFGHVKKKYPYWWLKYL